MSQPRLKRGDAAWVICRWTKGSWNHPVVRCGEVIEVSDEDIRLWVNFDEGSRPLISTFASQSVFSSLEAAQRKVLEIRLRG